MVAASLDEYIEAGNRFEKSLVIHRIVDQIQAEGGRFLKKDARVGKWCELTQQQSKEKVGHAIRDAANLYLSRQQKAETLASGEQLGSGQSQDARLKSPPSYAEVDYDTARIPSSEHRQRSTGRVSLPSSLQHSLDAEADAFDSQFSSRNFMQSPIERTTPQRLILASNVTNPYEMTVAQSRLANRQPGLNLGDTFGHQQPMFQSRQQATHGDLSSRLPAYMTHTSVLNRSDPQRVRQLQTPGPLVPQQPGFRTGTATTSDQTTASVRQQLMSLPYPPSTSSVARAFDPYDRIERDRLLLQQSAPNLHYQQQSQQHHDRIDDNDHFLDVINAVLGPIGHDTEDDTIPAGEVNVSDHHSPQQILFEPQLEHQNPSQFQFSPGDNDEDDRKPSPKERR
jgi:hypothetical protein